MKKTKIILLASTALLALAAVAMVIENPFSRVKDSWFEPDKDKLRQVPANLLVVRPTHFSHAYEKVRHYHNDDSLARTVGRDVSFQRMMAEAYDCDFADVILPAGAPQDRFDFLVTTDSEARKHLRMAIQKQLGYTAHTETRDTDALILTVIDPTLPGLTVSPNGEDDGASYQGGRLTLKHEDIGTIADALARGLNKPVIDHTGLTNYYNFSLPWDAKAQKALEDSSFDLEKTRQFLGKWGLGLEATNVSMEMYVATRGH
jgi:uncharacterized protein (TIGR03435 family)